MNQQNYSNIYFEPFDNKRLGILRGQQDENIRKIEKRFQVQIKNRGNHFQILGNNIAVQDAQSTLQKLYDETLNKDHLSSEDIHLTMHEHYQSNESQIDSEKSTPTVARVEIKTKSGTIRGHTFNQKKYLENIQQYDINFGIGPAGTGKTYLGVACVVNALEKQLVRRILLVRPAVEAGEKLGFLPGGLEQKVEPYLRPLYDALFEMLGFEQVNKLIQQNVIEVAPLAYMRGRTLNDSYIILDESQNTTPEQMKMFLTRIGFNSKAIITGDITQVDLPKGKKSGLTHAMEVLKDIPGICFTLFNSKDVVRHPLVQKIVEAYDKHKDSGESE